jgi:hypothetical protein
VFTAKEVREQAVFVAANQAGGIDVFKPMRSSALNPKLQDLCISIGLLARNTYYSFRRTAIVETRRKHGSEAARDLAFHKPGMYCIIIHHAAIGTGHELISHFRN